MMPAVLVLLLLLLACMPLMDQVRLQLVLELFQAIRLEAPNSSS